MANKTSIEWVGKDFQDDGTFTKGYTSNPIYAINLENGKRGHYCTMVDEECDFCYSQEWNLFRGNGLRYTLENESKVEWILNQNELDAIMKLKGRQRIFIGDMTDLFHRTIPEKYVRKVFDVMTYTDHTFFVLTKRPHNMKPFIEKYLAGRKPQDMMPNIILGVSCGIQKAADLRIPILLHTPAVTRFLSVEPLLEPVSLIQAFPALGCSNAEPSLADIHLVIVGAESGRRARPMQEEWVRDIKNECVAAEVAFFYKQDALKGKKISLPILDGERWVQMPEVQNVTK